MGRLAEETAEVIAYLFCFSLGWRNDNQGPLASSLQPCEGKCLCARGHCQRGAIKADHTFDDVGVRQAVGEADQCLVVSHGY